MYSFLMKWLRVKSSLLWCCNPWGERSLVGDPISSTVMSLPLSGNLGAWPAGSQQSPCLTEGRLSKRKLPSQINFLEHVTWVWQKDRGLFYTLCTAVWFLPGIKLWQLKESWLSLNRLIRKMTVWAQIENAKLLSVSKAPHLQWNPKNRTLVASVVIKTT